MRVFVTGASGFIGSAVVPELLSAGHQVIALARSDESAKVLAGSGVEILRGSLDDLDCLRRGAAGSDGVIHTAFVHDFSKLHLSGEIDRLAVEAMGAALAGTGKPLVVTSGTAVLKSGRLGTEADGADPGSVATPRIASEELTVSLAAKGVRASVLRLPPSVHGDGDRGFVPFIIALARQKGVSAYVGDGANRWPAVHRLDAVNLFRLVMEKGSAGARYHAAAEGGVPTREIAEVVGRRLNVPVVSVPAEKAAEHFGWIAKFFSIDNPTSGERTRAELGWQPRHAGLIADIDRPEYFKI